jgi:hypothetical protein
MRRIFVASVALLLTGGVALAQQAQQPSPPAPHGGHGAAPGAQQQRPMSDQDVIASAMSAAPRTVAEGATIVVMDANNSTRTLRRGTNGWTCMPDSPASPGQDPMCLDQNAMEWAGAWIGRRPPPDKIGFVFMLAGGSDASNTDPYAASPSPGGRWVDTGPHVMIVGPAVARMAGYPRGVQPDTTQPYVMWAGTPYEHLMIPIR